MSDLELASLALIAWCAIACLIGPPVGRYLKRRNDRNRQTGDGQ